ncbi:ceramide kinase-like [Paramacrobiotus metropolitanus]|uniref:ceramide kinase-like n=1 Tax=Paramacrobiotus metropolitanus TaxID=2943436 RepID=UPI002445FF89|nr:ceramide kinase-like [Paramacrobiotus metropolitanus]
MSVLIEPGKSHIIVKCNKVRYGATLENEALHLRALPGFPEVAQAVVISLRDVLSVEVQTDNSELSSARWSLRRLECFSRSGVYDPARSHSLLLHMARHVSHQKWRTKKVLLEPEVPEQGEELYKALLDVLKDFEERPKRLLFFVNPISGNGGAVRVMTKIISPILTGCGISYDFIVTTHQGHAKEWIVQQDPHLQPYDGIIAVGGDGIFNEIMEGVLLRAQVNELRPCSSLMAPAVRIGLIPAGSTDSIGFCIGLGDVVTALINILLGREMRLDVGTVFRASDGQFLKFFCAFLGYGFFSDTLRNSEKQWLRRYLGKSRYVLAGAKTFLVNRAYHGSVSFKSLESVNPDGYPDEGDECYQDCRYCKEIGASKSHISIGPEGSTDKEEWSTLDGKFTNVIAASMSCRSEMSPRGVVPVSHCGDGCLDLLVVRSIGRCRLLHYLVSTQRGIGPQRSLGSNLHACRAHELLFRTSESTGNSSTTIWNCDGEIIREPNIHVKVYCQVIRMFGSGLEPR